MHKVAASEAEKRFISIAKQKRKSFILLSAIAVISVIITIALSVYAMRLYDAQKLFDKYIAKGGIARHTVKLSSHEKDVLTDIFRKTFEQLKNNPLLNRKKLEQLQDEAFIMLSNGNISYRIIENFNKLAEEGLELSFEFMLIITILLLFFFLLLYLLTVYFPDTHLQKDIDLVAERLKKLETGRHLSKKGVAFKETALLIENADRTISRTLNIMRIYQMLSAVNQTIIRIESEAELFEEICKIFVNQGGFKLAWIGLLDKNNQIVSTHHCGDESYVNYIAEALNKNLYSGPTSKALKKGLIFINNNTAANKKIEPWKDEMLKRNYYSSASIPISKKGKLIGSLNIYSDIPNLFAKENFSLLKEIAGDISFALEKMENEKWMSITAQALEKSSSYIVIINQNLIIEYANRAAEKMLSQTGKSVVGENCDIINQRLKNRSLTKEFLEGIKADKPFNDLLIYSKKDGTLAYLDTTITYFEDSKQNSYFIVSGKDITEEVGLQNSVNKMLFYDFETDLPNRHAFLETAEIYIASIEKGKQAAIIIIDPHNFTYINDSLGFQAANRLLKAIGLRLTEILKKSDLVAKALGSKFFCLIKDVDAKYTLPDILKRIQNELAKPFDIDSDKITLSFHTGVAIYPYDGNTAVDLLGRAEIALRYNKQQYESEPFSPSFFTKQMELDIKKIEQLKESLANALTRKEFVLYYQPYFEPSSKILKGAEVLLRWKKEGKMIMPSEFIPFLEKSNMMSDVENWIIDQVCHDIGKWQKRGLKLIPVSINISPASFSKTELISHIVSVAAKHHADRSLLTIEITERLFISNLKQATETLNLLKKEGIRIAIDDFGTGYSSLSYLEQLPVDILKIDISFVRNMTKSDRSASLVKAIISVARALSLNTIAEGVETPEQLNMLKKLKCDAVQGWLFAKAMPEEQFESFLSKLTKPVANQETV